MYVHEERVKSLLPDGKCVYISSKRVRCIVLLVANIKQTYIATEQQHVREHEHFYPNSAWSDFPIYTSFAFLPCLS